MKVSLYIWTFLTLIFSLNVGAQDDNMTGILDSVRMKLERIEAYSVDATFRVDIDFVHMPEKQAKITFRAPDKIDVKADGFLMVPKVGIKPLTKQMDLEDYHSLYLGEETVNGDRCHVFKLIPKDRKSKIVLSTIWVSRDHLVRKWESFTKSAGNILLEFSYASEILPAEIVFSFEVTGMNIPVKYFGNEVEVDKTAMKDSEVMEGKVYVSFSNYDIRFK